MEAKIILLLICACVIAYGVYVIVTRYKKYKQSTDPKVRTAKMTSVVVAGVLIILVLITLIQYAI